VVGWYGLLRFRCLIGAGFDGTMEEGTLTREVRDCRKKHKNEQNS